MRKRCWIIGAGALVRPAPLPRKGDVLIACDGGFDRLSEKARPRLLVGDMDSIHRLPIGVPRLVLPKEKDDTDLAVALRLGFQKGYRHFVLDGIGGGRVDHLVGTLQLMAAYACKGAFLHGFVPGGEVFAFANRARLFPAIQKGRIVSIFSPMDQAKGVSLRGLRYSLHKAILTNARPLGVSNEALGGPVLIQVEKGPLLVFLMAEGHALPL